MTGREHLREKVFLINYLGEINMRTELNIFSKNSNQLRGTLFRTIFGQRQFGNFGAGEISVFNKRYDVVGKDVYLPDVVIKKLIQKGQFKKIDLKYK